jgi:KilA-N domain/T5orf172 domain
MYKMSLILNDIVIESRSDGFINATQLCVAGGKKFNNWFQLSSSKELIRVLEIDLNAGIPAFKKAVETTKGRYNSGSWIHPDLAVQLAQWISPSFAIQVSRWVRELMTTGSVQITTQKTDEQLINLQLQLDEKNKELLQKEELLIENNEKLIEKEKQLEEKEEHLQRLHILNIENLSFKKKLEKNETVYIVSTFEYSRQGIYKIGRTKNLKNRGSGHNTTHVNGDKIKVLASYKVNDSVLVEKNIHNKLAGLATKNDTEMFMCPYDLLKNLVELIIDFDEQANEAVNKIIETVYKLRTLKFDGETWTSGLDMNIFEESIKILHDDKEIAKFDIRFMNDEQKQRFMDECILAYKKINSETIIWTIFQDYLISRTSSPKHLFKPSQWRTYADRSVKSNKLSIKWRNI